VPVNKRQINRLTPEMRAELVARLRLNGLDDVNTTINDVVEKTARQLPDIVPRAIDAIARHECTMNRSSRGGGGGGPLITTEEIMAVKEKWDELGFTIGCSCLAASREISEKLGMPKIRCHNILGKLDLIVKLNTYKPSILFNRCRAYLARLTASEQKEFFDMCSTVQPNEEKKVCP
jgi:hypothetical protein